MTIDATPEFSIPVVLFGLVVLGFLATSAVGWLIFLINFKVVRNWSGWKPDRPATKLGLIDLITAFCCMLVAQFLLLGAMQPFIPKATNALAASALLTDDAAQEPASTPAIKMPSWVAPVLSLSYLVGGVLTVILVLFRTKAAPGEIGLSVVQWRRDLWVGLVAFLLVTPVILVLSQIAIRVTAVEYEHPVIDAMQEHPWTFPLLFFGAVICAPLWEEFIFRGLLIGWLDSVRMSKGNLRTILLGCNDPPSSENGDGIIAEVQYDSFDGNPYQTPSREPRQGVVSSVEPAVAGMVDSYPPWWPAIVSGLIFGLAHFGYGVSWIPLILFGTVLGRLYQLRRSILPGVIVHACFNMFSMLGLAVQILSGKG